MNEKTECCDNCRFKNTPAITYDNFGKSLGDSDEDGMCPVLDAALSLSWDEIVTSCEFSCGLFQGVN